MHQLNDQVFWYLKHDEPHRCTRDMQVDVAIVGGGMAGLSAAQAFSRHGKKVALFEQHYCGAGATGKSSGFITPNAEVSLSDFARIYSFESAQKIWQLFTHGVEDIRSNIQKYAFACDYTPQDTLVLARTAQAFEGLAQEYGHLTLMGYKAALYNAQELTSYVGSNKYRGAIRCYDSFGIDAYAYCQALKRHMQQQGVSIFEETPVSAINGNVVVTPHAKIIADTVVICVDRFLPQLELLSSYVSHVQTFLMISEKLTDKQIHSLFPERPYMTWDTDLIYTYFRLTGQGRLLLGGGSLLTTYATRAQHENIRVGKKLMRYLNEMFPHNDVRFEHMWPGLIGVTQDMVPLAGRDKERPYIYYIAGASGLPIAAALGRYSAEHMCEGRTDLDEFFSPYRTFPRVGGLQKIIGKQAAFALAHAALKFA